MELELPTSKRSLMSLFRTPEELKIWGVRFIHTKLPLFGGCLPTKQQFHIAQLNILFPIWGSGELPYGHNNGTLGLNTTERKLQNVLLKLLELYEVYGALKHGLINIKETVVKTVQTHIMYELCLSGLLLEETKNSWFWAISLVSNWTEAAFSYHPSPGKVSRPWWQKQNLIASKRILAIEAYCLKATRISSLKFSHWDDITYHFPFHFPSNVCSHLPQEVSLIAICVLLNIIFTAECLLVSFVFKRPLNIQNKQLTKHKRMVFILLFINLTI